MSQDRYINHLNMAGAPCGARLHPQPTRDFMACVRCGWSITGLAIVNLRQEGADDATPRTAARVEVLKAEQVRLGVEVERYATALAAERRVVAAQALALTEAQQEIDRRREQVKHQVERREIAERKLDEYGLRTPADLGYPLPGWVAVAEHEQRYHR